MQIKVVIEATDLSQEALTALVTALSGQAVTVVAGGAAAPETPAPATRSRTRRTEPAGDEPAPTPPEPETPSEPATPSEPESTTPPAPETESDAPAPTVVELRSKAQEKGTTPEEKSAIKALLVEFESKSISDVPEGKRAAFLAALDEL